MSHGLQKKGGFTLQSTHEILRHFYKSLWVLSGPKIWCETPYVFLFPHDAIHDVAAIIRRHPETHPYLSIQPDAEDFVGVCYSSLRLCEPPYQMVAGVLDTFRGECRYLPPDFWTSFDPEKWHPTNQIDPELLYERMIALLMKKETGSVIRVPKNQGATLKQAVQRVGRVLPQKLRLAEMCVFQDEFIIGFEPSLDPFKSDSVVYRFKVSPQSACEQICQIIEQP